MDELTLKRRAMPGAHQVEPMLVVSTAHMTLEEAGAIETGNHWATPAMQREEGFLFHVDHLLNDSGDFLTLSEGFRRVAQRAKALGCPWLLFDRDAGTIEDIPWNHW